MIIIHTVCITQDDIKQPKHYYPEPEESHERPSKWNNSTSYSDHLCESLVHSEEQHSFDKRKCNDKARENRYLSLWKNVVVMSIWYFDRLGNNCLILIDQSNYAEWSIQEVSKEVYKVGWVGDILIECCLLILIDFNDNENYNCKHASQTAKIGSFIFVHTKNLSRLLQILAHLDHKWYHKATSPKHEVDHKDSLCRVELSIDNLLNSNMLLYQIWVYIIDQDNHIVKWINW